MAKMFRHGLVRVKEQSGLTTNLPNFNSYFSDCDPKIAQ